LRPILILTVLLAVCSAGDLAPEPDHTHLGPPQPEYVAIDPLPGIRADGPMPEVIVEGAPSGWMLRPGLTLPEPRDIVWNGDSYTLRWIEDGGEAPYPPLPGSADPGPTYPNVVLIGGTDDPARALVVRLIACSGGYDAGMTHAIPMPPRHAPTGDWVFDVNASRCDHT
jgi:hypothetical protein